MKTKTKTIGVRGLPYLWPYFLEFSAGTIAGQWSDIEDFQGTAKDCIISWCSWEESTARHFAMLITLTLERPGGVDATPPPLAFFPCNFFYDSNRKNRLGVSVTRDGRHILTYVTSSWRCHVTYVMTSYVHDGGQNTLFFTTVCQSRYLLM